MEIIVANTFFKRLFGLMNRKNVSYGMLFLKCRSIHTFFMKCNIDIFILNKDMEIIGVRPNIAPNRIIICHEKDAYSVLEMPILSSRYHLKDKIDIKKGKN